MAFAANHLDLHVGSPHSLVDTLVDPGSSPSFPESPRMNDGPLPLPSFVFPAKANPASAPSSFSRATSRRPVSTIELAAKQAENAIRPIAENTHKTPELPPFAFGAQSHSPPTSPRHIPSRSGAHKRGTSEFIGGDGLTGNGMGLMSTSPTKGDGVLPQPIGFGPTGGRRGHRHVRSAAISQHDLSMILKPPTYPDNMPRGSSAPCSPSGEHEIQKAHANFPSHIDYAKQRGNGPHGPSLSTEGTGLPDAPTKSLNRARVGFSDNIEVIPRPLSLVSSDSSSTTTMRQGHSVSNSISSIISAGPSSPPSKENRGLSPPKKTSDARPRTAEPLLSHSIPSPSDKGDQLRRRNSIPLLVEASAGTPPSAPSTPRSAKKWNFFSHESAPDEMLSTSRPTSPGSEPKESPPPSAVNAAIAGTGHSADIPLASTELINRRRSTSITRKPSKKQKKVRNWAGSILSRKPRQRSQKQKLSRRSPTPPHRAYSAVDDHAVTPSAFTFYQPDRSLPRPDQENDIASWKPRKVPCQDESVGPMIDLDAALGPFNTPSSFENGWTSPQNGGGPRKKAMHSSGSTGGFAGPGMHYHRRAESAPEFENPRFGGLHRLGSSSTMGMEDVFEEDEDEWEDAKASSDKDDTSKISRAKDNESGIDITVEDVQEPCVEVENDSHDGGSINRGLKRKGSGLSEGDRHTVGTAKSEHSATSLIDEPIQEEPSSLVEILDDSSSSRPDSRARSSDSTATPPFRSRPGKELAPVDVQPFTLQPPLMLSPTSPHSTTQSSFPSPRSPFSYDAQRISTAPSSVTDEQGFQSLLLGEPGPELRYSVDDVPSLTSSNSTMTRDSGLPATHNPQFRDGQRSASLSSAAVTRKRSSMVSLTRLISSSHGEKSKLSIECRAPSPVEAEKKEKGNKSKRISRMMQFWKPKESS